MQFLVIDIDLAHLGSHLLPHLGLHVLGLLLLRERLTHLHDARLLDEFGEVERGLLDTALSLQVL